MNYYINHGTRIELTPSSSFLAVRYDPGTAPSAIAALATSRGFGPKSKVVDLPTDRLALLPIQQGVHNEALSVVKRHAAFKVGPKVFERDGALLVPDGLVNADLSSKTDTEAAALLAKVGADIVRRPEQDFPFTVLVPRDGDALVLANRLAEVEGIDAQPRFTKLLRPPRRMLERPLTPEAMAFPRNDPYYPNQWGLRAVKADQAWSVTNGRAEVIVAVLDTGVAMKHPDLAPNLITGYDDVDGDDYPEPFHNEDNAHGTACAGIIAAAGDNGVGMVGVAPRCRLLPIRLARSVNGYLEERPEAEARCIRRAVRMGAWVLSNSYGGPQPDMTTEDAIRFALREGRQGKGCVVLASSGNDNGAVKYPAAYDGVIAVAATRHDHDRCTPADWGSGNGSCFGPEIVLAAPGIDVWTTDMVGYTSTFAGTSAACPFAAGVAALVLSVNPNLTGVEVRAILERTADKTGSGVYDARGWNEYLGHGRVNALAAVKAAGG